MLIKQSGHVGYALKSQDWKSEYCRFCGKIYFFEEYLTWIVFGFKLDIFKNNMRFGFILKDCF
jgi:hypothetical protein